MSDADRLKYMNAFEEAVEYGNQTAAKMYATALIEGGADEDAIMMLYNSKFNSVKSWKPVNLADAAQRFKTAAQKYIK